MISITAGRSTATLNEQTLGVTLERDGQTWTWREGFSPRLLAGEGEFPFLSASLIFHDSFRSGVGSGIRSRFERLGGTAYSFETLIWIEKATGDIYFEWIPLCEKGLHPQKLFWPGEMSFEEPKDSWQTLLTCGQGLLIPNTWETALGPLPFDGFFETSGGFMPWFGQLRDGNGYIAICETPWDAGCRAEHPAGGPFTHAGVYYTPSLGRMDYRRVLRYTLLSGCDYNDLCKIYRRYAQEKGLLRTLAEKAVQNPSVDRLIGCSFVHTGIKTVVQPESDFYDPENPEKNNHMTPFSQRAEEILRLHDLGVEKLYLHLDGWAQPGYDNRHPDYFPACREAGDWKGMRALADTLHRCGYLFGIHDQYRDYYLSAPSFDEGYACLQTDGTIPRHSRWAGGPQSYLCATQALYYVRRNFKRLFQNGISLDAAYLDVFTCNEGDECANPEHRMTRRDCYEYRGQCFSWLLSQGILSSSEEVSDWAVPSLIFCHYAPYRFMLRQPGEPKQGIPVPLFNLVYHDCVIQPWMMDRPAGAEDYMLYALLNGGAPYLLRDGAYPETDGAFSAEGQPLLKEMADRCRIVAAFHERVAKCEMTHHNFDPSDWRIQESQFSDGSRVKIDLGRGTFQIL
ncbi:MAG: DUF5696 domain-containing protein [Eubacteriales bacterium]|nr:DUF5696 domain-containing protein [Eubacteriales bacterium]